MQQTKIKIDTEYVIDDKAISEKYGYMARQVRNGSGPVTATVINKGMKRDQWSDRKDGVLVRIPDERYAPIKAWIDQQVERASDERKDEVRETQQRRYPQQFMVIARHIVEAKADRDRRIREAEERRRQAEALRNQELRERAEGITPEMIGQMMEQGETEMGRAATQYRERLNNAIRRMQEEVERLDGALDFGSSWTAKPKDATQTVPTADRWGIDSAIERVVESKNEYSERARRHNMWVNAKQQGRA